MRTAQEILDGIADDARREHDYGERCRPRSERELVARWRELCDAGRAPGDYGHDDVVRCYFADIVKPLYLINFFHMLVCDRAYIKNYLHDITAQMNIATPELALEILRTLPTDFRNILLSTVDNQAAFDRAVTAGDAAAFTALCMEHNHEISDLLRLCHLLQRDFEIVTIMDHGHENDVDVKPALERHTKPITSGLRRMGIDMSDDTVLRSQYLLYFSFEGTYTAAEQARIDRLFADTKRYYGALHEHYYTTSLEQYRGGDASTPAKPTGRKPGTWLNDPRGRTDADLGARIRDVLWPSLRQQLATIHCGSLRGEHRDTAINALAAAIVYRACVLEGLAKDYDAAGARESFARTMAFTGVSRNTITRYVTMVTCCDEFVADLRATDPGAMESLEAFARNSGVDKPRVALLTRDHFANVKIIIYALHRLQPQVRKAL